MASAMRTDGLVSIVPATTRERGFVRRLSAEVFSRFGNYEATLPPLIGAPGIHGAIARVGRRAIGFTLYSIPDRPQDAADLLAIAVAPAWQSRGVGTLLLQHVEQAVLARARPGSAVAVQLSVAEDNLAARRLFEDSGYNRVHGQEGYYSGGQRSWSMRKELRS